MSFSFHAVGTKEDVTAQLEKASITAGEDRFNLIAVELRDLLANHFRAETAHPGGAHEYRYMVSASGHGGGNTPVSLNLTVTPAWVPVIDTEPEVVNADIDDDEDD